MKKQVRIIVKLFIKFGFLALFFLTACNPLNVNKIKIKLNNPNDVTPSTQSLSASANSSLSITLTALNPESLTLTYTITGSPSHGTLTGTAPSLTYTPTSSYVGADSFTFKVNNSAVATISIMVTALSNQIPTATTQSVDVSYNMITEIILAGNDADGDTLTYAITGSPSHGSLSGSAPNLIYSPTGSFSGADSFTFKMNDGNMDSSTVTMSSCKLALSRIRPRISPSLDLRDLHLSGGKQKLRLLPSHLMALST